VGGGIVRACLFGKRGFGLVDRERQTDIFLKSFRVIAGAGPWMFVFLLEIVSKGVEV